MKLTISSKYVIDIFGSQIPPCQRCVKFTSGSSNNHHLQFTQPQVPDMTQIMAIENPIPIPIVIHHPSYSPQLEWGFHELIKNWVLQSFNNILTLS
jgi:hypothetical protein